MLEGPSLFAHLDPRRDGVIVPSWLRKQSQLVLQVGMNMAVPIPDLKVEDDGLSCTLSFNRTPFWCHLPWTAVYALVGEEGRGMVWPDDVPAELAAHPPRPQLSVVPSKRKTSRAKSRAKPEAEPAAEAAEERQVDDGPGSDEEPAVAAEAQPDSPDSGRGDEDEDGPNGPDGPDGKKKLPPYLRVIK